MRITDMHGFVETLKEELISRFYRGFNCISHRNYLCMIAEDLYGPGGQVAVSTLIREAFPNSLSYGRYGCMSKSITVIMLLDSAKMSTLPALNRFLTIRLEFLDRLLAQPDRMIVIPGI